jgi:hypothetical protein
MTTRSPNWQICDKATLTRYAEKVDSLLKSVHVPLYLLTENIPNGYNTTHEIDLLYNSIINTVQSSVSDTIPHCNFKHKNHEYITPGWNDYVKDKHDIARDAFKHWIFQGKKKQGDIFENMKRSRATFKLALRYCRHHNEQIQADLCAKNMNNTDPRKFWNNVRKISNSNAANLVASVGGATGDCLIANMWKEHFQSLYNSTNNEKYYLSFIKEMESSTENSNISVCCDDISTSVKSQKLGKAPGPDNLCMESFMYGGSRLQFFISIFFNLCIKFGHLPSTFCEATIIPLVKSKMADLTDVNNYRAIAVSSAMSKIFESLLLQKINLYNINKNDDYQFGFKQNHSTTSCSNYFKKTVQYYTSRGSHVFACFIDFNKAFDSVNYWLLFKKLLVAGLPKKLVCLLAFWYSNQQMSVRWQKTESNSFGIGNGVRQGSILSPLLFNFYIQDLISSISNLRIGCNIGGIFMNVLAYADDMVLIAPSWFSLQKLINFTNKESSLINMSFNTKKTVCMVFNPSQKSKVISNSFPELCVSGCEITFVESFKYLGHIIKNDLTDDLDMIKEMKGLYTRTNILIRRFHLCSNRVKVKLFKAYCICIYGVSLWQNYNGKTMARLQYCYNKCAKMFFGYNKYDSISYLLLELRLPSFYTIILNYRLAFRKQLMACTLVNHSMHSVNQSFK